MGEDLSGKTISIFGYGRIGKMVGRLASAFGMLVLPCARCTSVGNREEILRESDVISLHLPADRSFAGFIDRKKLKIMKKSAVVVNTARPYMVDKNDLLWALTSREIRGAALDYLGSDTEKSDADLVNYACGHSNLILTPHLGGYSTDAVHKASDRLVRKVGDLVI